MIVIASGSGVLKRRRTPLAFATTYAPHYHYAYGARLVCTKSFPWALAHGPSTLRACADSPDAPEKVTPPTPSGEASGATSAAGGLDVEKAPAWRVPAAAALYGIFVIHNIVFGPGPLLDPGAIGKIIVGDTAEVNDLFIAVFYALGQVGLLYFGLLMPAAGKQTKLPTFPSCIAGALLGFFGLGPYLAVRNYAPSVSAADVESQGLLGRVFESRIFGGVMLALAFAIYFKALGLGAPSEVRDVVFYACWQDTARLFAEDRGVHATLLDGTLLSTVMMWGPLCEDMRRRGWRFGAANWDAYVYACFILSAPCLGPALYLTLRPRLPGSVET